jgi:flagellar protein FliS
MTVRAGGSREYLRNSVLTASPEQLQLMLFDGAIRYATQAREGLERGETRDALKALERAQAVVLELMRGMRRDVQPALVDQLRALYDFIYRRLVDATFLHDLAAVDDALRILRHQRETWVMLLEKLADEQRDAMAAAASTRAPAPSQPTQAQATGSTATLSVEG